MMNKDEALRMALVMYYSDKDITAIKKALEQPEQEPVAYGMWDTMVGKNRLMMVRLDKGQDGCTVPLYTHPSKRTWVGLTDDEIESIADMVANEKLFGTVPNFRLRFARAIEAKLKQKNNPVNKEDIKD